MNNQKSYKKITFAVILTLFVNILCLPLWTEYDYGGFVRTLFNKEARLDLLYSGKIIQAEPFAYKVSPQPLYDTWWYGAGDNVHRANLSLRAKGKWQRLSLQLKAQRDGKIAILFRGAEVRDEYGFFCSVLTDWRNIKLNGKTILPKRETFSFKKHFTKQLSVKKGELFHIEAEFRRHHFSVHDFTRLKSGKIWYIITGNLLLFFLACRLLSYIRGGGIGSDVLLLAIFFTLLFIPMINISDAVNSRREARRLSVKPELKDILFKEKSDYGRRYENYFNDHFCGRVFLMKLHDNLRNKLSCVIRAKEAIHFKRNGWMFAYSPVQDSSWSFSPTFAKSIVHNLSRLNKFCQQNQIKFYVFEVPKKEIIYKDLIKENYGFDEKKLAEISRAQEALRNEARKHHISWIYPYEALCDASEQDLIFFKESTHWTDWGAFVGYGELMKEVRKDFPNMPIASLDDYRKTSNRLIRDEWCRNYYLWFPQRFFNLSINQQNLTLTNYYDHKNGDKMIIHVGQFKKDFTYPLGKHKIMLLGTSNSENFTQFLPYTANQTRYIRLNRGQVRTADEFKILKLYKKDILAFKPDILILCIYTNNLPRLRDICATK